MKFVCLFMQVAGAIFLTTAQETEIVEEKSFSFASYYGDHMVLQKSPQQANVWGYTSNDGVSVRVQIDGSEAIDTESFLNPVTSLSVWIVQLPAMSAGGPHNITATSVEGTITLTDILFGDVWICSGQSNMQFTVSMGLNASAEIADAKNYPNIRVFTASLDEAPDVQYDLLSVNQSWSLPNNDSIGGKDWDYFSAVCWLYGKYLYHHLNYPIGLIATSYGGTRVEAWSSPTVLTKCGVKYVEDPENPNDASVLWNAMIHPFLNMTIYGAIWYQGESNASPNTTMAEYNCTFPGMISDWRSKFHGASFGQTDPVFPFGFVQLAGWKNDSSLVNGFSDIRWHQTADYGYVPNPLMQNVFMAVAMDLPDFNSPYTSIHPQDKQDVAMRLMTAGLDVAYGESAYSRLNGPTPHMLTVYVAEGTIQIDFEKDITLEIRTPDGFEITCISLTNSTGNKTKWSPLPLKSHDNTSVTLDYSKLCLQSKDMLPSEIRYAWRESPCEFKKCAIYNKMSGYPAPPFYKNILDGHFEKLTSPILKYSFKDKCH